MILIDVFEAFQDKLMFEDSLREYVIEHEMTVQRYLNDNINIEDHVREWDYYFMHPLLGKAIIDNYSLNNEEKTDKIINRLATTSTIILVIGRRGFGKTSLAFWIAEQLLNKGITPCFLNTGYDLPYGMLHLEDIHNAPEGSVVFVDESALEFQARRAMSKKNVEVTEILAIARHQGLSLVFISQHNALLDTNIRRMADAWLFKRISWEESQAKEEHRAINVLFQFVKRLMPKNPAETLYFDGDEWLSFTTPLPNCWSQKLSKPFAKITLVEAVDMSVRMSEEGKHIKDILQQIRIRCPDSASLNEADIRDWLRHPVQAKQNLQDALNWKTKKPKELPSE